MTTNLSPIGWALRPFKRYATFSGRASRAEFWWFTLFLMIAYFAIWLIFVGSLASLATMESDVSTGAFGALGAGMIVIVLFWLAVIIPTLAVQARRLHDSNRSGWWLGAYYVLYAVYMVAALGMTGSVDPNNPPDNAMALFGGIAIVGVAFFVYSIVLLVFFCLAGTKGPNRFGEDPYGEDVEDVFA